MQRHSLKSISYANSYLIVLLGKLSDVYDPLLREPHASPISAEYSTARYTPTAALLYWGTKNKRPFWDGKAIGGLVIAAGLGLFYFWQTVKFSVESERKREQERKEQELRMVFKKLLPTGVVVTQSRQ